jgi:class 3 adenylate cyclase/tetratricopeptide (TPR) repeat protein
MSEFCCQSCGHRNRADARFCADCGVLLERACWQCGRHVTPLARYCDRCGTKLDGSEQPGGASAPAVVGERFEEPERRQLTVMFCDLVESTRLARLLDPEELRHVIRSFQDACGGVVAHYGGYISRYAGDGILILFGYPRAHDDDAQRAAWAGLEIVKAVSSLQASTSTDPVQLSVRIGIATGLVVAGDIIGKQASQEKAIVGETPALAARLQALARPNGILVSQATYRLIGDTLPCRPAGSHALKGYAEPVEVFEVNASTLARKTVTGLAGRKLTPLVGRDRDLALLTEHWAQTSAGRGRTVFVRGEPGIGKSRIVAELKASLEPGGHRVVECGCSPYFTNSPLYPVIDMFQHLVRPSPSDTQETIVAKLEAAIDTNGHAFAHASELASLLLAPKETPEGDGRIAPEPERIRPLELIISLLLALAHSRPLLFIVENLHWADPSTLRLLSLLVDQAPSTRILVLATARPECRPDWLSRSHTTDLELVRLMPAEAEAMVDTLTADTPLPPALRELLVTKSDGVPLFVEELTRTVVDVADLEIEISDFSGTGTTPIPETLRDSLMARLDRMQDAKQLAQLAAVIGRHFSYALLRAVANIDEVDLQDRLTRLVDAELLYEHGHRPESCYSFKHALIRDTAYDSLLTSKRREYHGRIAAVIEAEFAGISGMHLEMIARHYAMARANQKACDFWKRAGELALQRSADLEAANHAREGLRIVGTLDDGPTKDKLELGLQVILATSLSATEGYAVPQVEDAYGRALQLCESIEASDNFFFPVFRGLHSFYLLRGPLAQAIHIGNRLVEIAKTRRDNITLTEATRCLGWTLFCNGRMREGQEHVQRAIAMYDQAYSREHTRHNVSDAGGVGLVNLAWINWFLGYPDAAVNCARKAIDLARQIDHPFTLAYALCMSAAVYQCRREPDSVELLAKEAVAIAAKHAFPYWDAWGTSLLGWTMAQRKAEDQGIATIRKGLADYRATGAALFVPYILNMLAEALARKGDARAAADLLHEALVEEQNRGIHLFSAETHRLLAKIMWDLGDQKAAREGFERALGLARNQAARSLELRTTASIVKTAPDAGETRRARERLEAILDSMREGHNTLDYREALRLTGHTSEPALSSGQQA